MRSLFLSLALVFTHGASAMAQTPPVLAETDRFQLLCRAADNCDDSAARKRTAQGTLAQMEQIRTWLDGMDFPPAGLLEHERASGKERLRLDHEPAAQGRCGANATACHVTGLRDTSYILLPIDNFAAILKKPSTLAHEYSHSRQPSNTPTGEKWLNEAVATAIGQSWGNKQGGGLGIDVPIYYMTLDQPFYEAADPGYGNWAYLLEVGKAMGSQDFVAYLSDASFMNASRLYSSAAGAMKPFYAADKVGGQTFDKLFPRFVAQFNNMDQTGDAASAYSYYKDIARKEVKLAGTQAPEQLTFRGTANVYAAAPVHLKLEVGSEGADEAPKDRLLMADIEVVLSPKQDALTLVSEHRMGETQHRKSYMIAGATPPPELGLTRVVYAPKTLAPEGAAPTRFTLQVTTQPIQFNPPACFQAGQAAALEPVGFDPARADNWRLTTNNGTVDGLTVTPARAGKMELRLEVDSPVTRAPDTIAPKRPAVAKVSLGDFDVASTNCMIRLTMGRVQITYSTDGSYSEFQAPTGETMYFGPYDMALFHNGWQVVPEMAKQMILSRMVAQMPVDGHVAPGEDEAQGVFLSRMPHAFSKRFAWANLRGTRDVNGNRARRVAADCPDGGSGCSGTTFSMDGNAVPVVFDAQRRPVSVQISSETMRFEYGYWDIRRPPGW